MPRIPTTEELQELIDGRLGGERLREVLNYLASNPRAAEMVQRMRKTDNDLRRLGRLLATGRAGREAPAAPPTPARTERGTGGTAGRRPVRAAGFVMAAALLVAASGAAGWWAHDRAGRDADETVVNHFVGELTATYSYLSSSSGEIHDFAADQHEQFAAWSSRTLGVGLSPPDLSEDGFEYVGARVLPGASRIGSMLAYRAEDATITIYYWKGQGSGPRYPTAIDAGDYRIRLKTHDSHGLAVVGPSHIDHFERIAERVFETFSQLVETDEDSGDDPETARS